MDKYSSRELAFFSMLETTLNLNLVDEKSNFVIDLAELSSKLTMKTSDIVEHLRNLEGMELLKIKDVNESSVKLDMSNSHTKLFEVFSFEEIDKLLKEFDFFVKKYDTLLIKRPKLEKYIEKIKSIMFEDSGQDINDIIKEGLSEIFDDSEVLLVEKEIYRLCEVIPESEMEIIEVVLFCLYNFKKVDNPFFVTLFLASIYKQIG